jgi:hypothetical protein
LPQRSAFRRREKVIQSVIVVGEIFDHGLKLASVGGGPAELLQDTAGFAPVAPQRLVLL